MPTGRQRSTGPCSPTSRDVLGPFFVVGAPFRGKLSPPAASGDTIVIRGQVLCARTGEPLPEADRVYHPRQHAMIIRGGTDARSRKFEYRTRLLTDHEGRFEVETQRPAPYYDPDDVCEHTETATACLCAWRCPHIHVYVQPTSRHKLLISQVRCVLVRSQPEARWGRCIMLVARMLFARIRNVTFWRPPLSLVSTHAIALTRPPFSFV